MSTEISLFPSCCLHCFCFASYITEKQLSSAGMVDHFALNNLIPLFGASLSYGTSAKDIHGT